MYSRDNRNNPLQHYILLLNLKKHFIDELKAICFLIYLYFFLIKSKSINECWSKIYSIYLLYLTIEWPCPTMEYDNNLVLWRWRGKQHDSPIWFGLAMLFSWVWRVCFGFIGSDLYIRVVVFIYYMDNNKLK